MFGEILGAIGGSLLGGMFADERQEDANAFSAQQYATRYQTTVKDLQAAGLNPMLAYGQGPGTAPSGQIASPINPDIVGAMRTAGQNRVASAQVENIEADTANKAAQGALYEAQAMAQRASAGAATATEDLSRAGIDNIRSEIQKRESEIRNLDVQKDVLHHTVTQLQRSSDLMLEQGMTQTQVRAHLQSMIYKLLNETKLIDFDIEAAKSLGNLGRESGQFKPILELLVNMMRIRR